MKNIGQKVIVSFLRLYINIMSNLYVDKFELKFEHILIEVHKIDST